MLRNTCNFPQYRVMEEIKKDAGGRVSFRASEIIPLNGVYNTIFCFAFDREAEFLFEHVKKGDLVNLCCQMESFKNETDGITRSGFKVLLCSVVGYMPDKTDKGTSEPKKNAGQTKTCNNLQTELEALKQKKAKESTPKEQPTNAPNSHLADFAKMLEQYRKGE